MIENRLSIQHSCMLLAFFCTLTLSSADGAVPQQFKVCNGVRLVPNQGLLLFDKDCTAAFLLPKAAGALTVTGTSFAVANASCANIRVLEQAALGSFGHATENQEERERLEAERQDLRLQSGLLRQEITSKESSRSQVQTRLDLKEPELIQLNQKFATACNSDRTANFQCLGYANDIDDLEAKITTWKGQVLALSNAITQNTNVLTSRQARLVEIGGELAALAPTGERTAAQLEAINTLGEQRKFQGAVVSINLTTTLQDDLRRLRERNPANPIAIDQMRFDSGTIHVAGANASGEAETTGEVSITMPGQQNAVTGVDGVLFNNATGVKLEFDRVAACQVFNYSIPSNADLATISSRLSANVVAKAYLNYKALLGVKITVHLEHAKFYQMIVSTSSKNGFFKSETIKRVSEELRASGSLTTSIVDEGGGLSDEQKQALATAMRNSVIQRALDKLGAKYVGVDLNANPATPMVGAPVASAELRKCANKWCQAGAAVIDVAHAIFGGSDSVQSFVQSLNVTETETFSNEQAFPFFTDMVFIPTK